MEIKYIKSAARVLNRNFVNKRGLDLSKKVLWISVDQRASDLQAVKVGGQKKICRSARCGRSGFEPLLLTQSLFKTLAALLMYFISIQSDLISIVFI